MSEWISEPDLVTQQDRKILLMGLAASGKSSIVSIIFEGKNSNDLSEYRATVNYKRIRTDIARTKVQIIDMGGQEKFLSLFVNEMPEFIFSDVKVLVWVIDIANFDISKSKPFFDLALENLSKFSPHAQIFCLLHKIDLINSPPEKEEEFFNSLKQHFKPLGSIPIQYYTSSIYDQSLSKIF